MPPNSRETERRIEEGKEAKREGMEGISPRYVQDNPWVRSLGPRQASAKARGIPFTLKVADVKAVWTGRCAVTGLPFDVRKGVGKGPRPFSPSLDRIRPRTGYVPGNIRWVLQCVNAFKGTMTDALMARVAEKVQRGILKSSAGERTRVTPPR